MLRSSGISAAFHVLQNSLMTSSSCSLQNDGFVTTTEPIFLTSRDIGLCERVLRDCLSLMMMMVI